MNQKTQNKIIEFFKQENPLGLRNPDNIKHNYINDPQIPCIVIMCPSTLSSTSMYYIIKKTKSLKLLYSIFKSRDDEFELELHIYSSILRKK